MTLFSHYQGKWHYNCHFSPGALTAAFVTSAGDHCVSAYSQSGMILLPDLWLHEQPLWRDVNAFSRKPTPEGIQVATDFRNQIIALHQSITGTTERTPQPAWATRPDFALPEERPLKEQIDELDRRASEIANERARVATDLEKAGQLRDLLFETGKPLERAVRSALQELGFAVSTFDNGVSEFDVVFESAEGRFIGEVEGREKTINVSKISQLRRNVDEDFAREDVSTPAIGVLFGNGHRLQPPRSRSECFTEKVISAAPALGIALVDTTDLFEAVRMLKQTGDDEFALQCRRAIADSVGEIVKFPTLRSGSASKRRR